MNDYKIITDSTSDMPESFYEENNVGVMCIPYILNGVTHTEENPIAPKEFYRMMREEGALPTTSQISPAAARAYLEKFLKETKKLVEGELAEDFMREDQVGRLLDLKLRCSIIDAEECKRLCNVKA